MSFLREPNAEPFPGYRLIEPLGTGGFGEVWKCEAPGGLFKAIKFVYGNLNSVDGDAARAEQELGALNRIKEVRHPFVLSMDRIEIVGGEVAIVMELADKSLHDAYVECQAAGLVGIPRDALLRYIRDASEALDHMMEKHNLLHLDIKPRNLFLISDRVKVADFGLVKNLERASGSGILGGVTPLYAPPETLNNKITPFSDQYSLAIVYQELLTGQRPFNGKNVRQLAMQHMHDEPELRSLPEAERPVIARALAKDPTKRFPNCLAFVRALYNARPKTSKVTVESTTASGNRPKTMADTMEDMLLEQLQESVVEPAEEDEAKIAEESLDFSAGEGEGEEVSQLGLTVAQPQTGALRPTLLVGVGNFGRQALLELRCRFLDRFGDLSKVPLMRFLYVDCDPEAVKMATQGSPEVALANAAVHHLPLQAAGNYRRRMLDHLTEWLPREKLYSIPRSFQTQGSRALGRLAFTDNHLRLLTKLRRDLEQASHPDSLYESVSQTGLALRGNVPRIYVFAAAGGGSSGMLVDLGYSLRRLLNQLHFTDAEVILFLMCGAPNDPATPRQEQANVYATVTELNHYCDPEVPFAAQYGPDAPRLVDAGGPYHCTYLMQLANRTPEAFQDAVAHLGSYVFHDVTTPLGLRLDKSRQSKDRPSPFRSFGTYAVWFPRGLLLRLAARQTCSRLLEEWQAIGDPTAAGEIAAACSRAVEDGGLKFEAICAHIQENARLANEGSPAQAMATFLAKHEEQSQLTLAREDPGTWAKQTVAHLQDWFGKAGAETHDSGWRKSRLGRALGAATQQLAQEWDQRLAQIAFELMENHGRRVAAAEDALQRLMSFCQESAQRHQALWEAQARKTEQVWSQLAASLESCLAGGGGFSLFGGRSRRVLRGFLEHLAAFARQRLSEEITGAGVQFYLALNGRFEERLRELTFCRQRLRHLQECLEAGNEGLEDTTNARFPVDWTPSNTPIPSPDTYWETIRQSATVRVVLPEGEVDLERAAGRFVSLLTQDQWTLLDQALQERVLGPLGGLHHICVSGGDLLRGLAVPLTTQAAACLGDLLPVTDVAQVEFSVASAERGDIQARAQLHFANAAPMVSGRDPNRQQAYLLVPASEAGRNLGDQAKEVLPTLQLVRVPGQAFLMFCREQGYLSTAELQYVLRSCQPAYEESASVPALSPHARFDITDWVPINP